MKNRTRILSAAIVAATMAGGSAHAVAYTEEWDNGAADNDFTNPLNWANDTNGPLHTLTATNDIWTGSVNLADIDYCEFNSPGLEVFVKQLNVGTTATGEFRLVDGAINSHLNPNGAKTFNRTIVGSGGFSGVFLQSGGTYLANKLHLGYTADSTGQYIMTGGVLENGGGEGTYGSSIIIAGNGANAGMTGLFEISGGTLSNHVRGVELGNSAGSIGTFHVIGTGPDMIEFGGWYSNTNNGFAEWYQASNSVLKVGIDETATGVTPIQLVDLVDQGRNDVVFQPGALLEPYFTDAAQTGKWTVLEADDFTDYGIGFAPSVTDPEWSFTITNNALEVWYGLGDSGYVSTNAYVPPPAPGRTLYWTGAGGDTDSSNAVNWVVDISGTPATWGIYSQDTLWIGHSDFVDAGVVSEVDYDGSADFNAQNLLYIGNNRTGILNMNSGTLTFTKSVNSRQSVGLGSVDGDGTINMNGGNLTLNTLRVGASSANGTININSGALDISRQKDTLDGISTSISLGYGGTGTADLTISGGSLTMRGGVQVGRSGGASTFCVEGSGATEITVGRDVNSIDGAFAVHPTGTMKFLVDEGGVTPIHVNDDASQANANGGHAYFKDGAQLDVGFTGYDGENGSWDVMQWEGTLMESNLAFAASVDTSIWSFEFVDTGLTTNGVDTLRVNASGFGPEVQPNITAFSVAGSTVSLSWDSELGIKYNVLSRMDMVNSGWSTNVAAIPGAGSTTSTNLSGPGAVEFYRIEAYEE